MQRAFFATVVVGLLSACGNSSSSSDPAVDSAPAGDEGTADSATMLEDATDSATADSSVVDSAIADVTPDAPFTVSAPSRISAGGNVACAISSTGSKQCWGREQGTIHKVAGAFQRVVVQEADRGYHPRICFILADGAFNCSSSLDAGSTGATAGPYVDLGVNGSGGVCAVRASGELECAASGGAMTRVGSANDWKRVTAGRTHQIALNAAGTLFGWGTNPWGESVPSTPGANVTAPTVIDKDHAYRDVDATDAAACAVRSDGGLYCWGERSTLFARSSAPLKRIGTDTDWASVRVTLDHACGLKSSGALYCWGVNDYGQLGRGSVGPDLAADPVPAPVGTDTDWTDVAVGRNFTCATKTSGAVLCWGSNVEGSLGLGYNDYKRPTKVGDGFASVAANGATTCAITTLGALQCWGNTSVLSGGSLRQQSPKAVGTETFRGIALGDKRSTTGDTYSLIRTPAHYGCARRTDDTVQCFGTTSVSGETGLALAAGAPTAIGTSAKELAAGLDRTCAITPLGALECWGRGTSTPTSAATGTWLKVAVARSSAFAIANDTSLYEVPSPSAAVSGPGWTALAAKGEHEIVFGIRSGRLYSITGTGVSEVSTSAPDSVAVAVGTRHQCAVRTTGQLDCWGDDYAGSLGGGTDIGWGSGWTRSWTAVATGDYHTCGIRNAGELYCWGLNHNGQVGDGTLFRDRPTAVPL